MLFKEAAESAPGHLDPVSLGRDSASIMLTDGHKRGHQREHNESQKRAQDCHRWQSHACRDRRPQDRGQEVRAEVRDFVDRPLERIQQLAHRSSIQIIRGERIEMVQQSRAQSERRPLRRPKGEVSAQAAEHGSSLVTHEDQPDGDSEKMSIARREDGIDQPPNREWRDQGQQAREGEAQKAGNMREELRLDLRKEPAEFWRK